ncbi:UvrABC system protein C UvrC [Mycobacteroides abscessus]|nr:UvrABC system protein C UvrC [Mycobacteroides abscessus]
MESMTLHPPSETANADIDVVLVTGLSGAGRGTTAKVLEDLGWYVADNLPPELITRMVDLGLAAGSRITQLAVVMDVRSRGFTGAAAAELSELGVTDVAVIGLAKRLEEVWVPGEPDPVILPRTSEALYLLQRVRDEAHRFAITFHRSKRSRRMTASVLDGIPGLGEARRAALVSHFGSVAQLKKASVEEITAVPGIGAATAVAVREALIETDSSAPSSGATEAVLPAMVENGVDDTPST